jgi:acetyltransferase-like isoleucine patch superfamily enzyme
MKRFLKEALVRLCEPIVKAIVFKRIMVWGDPQRLKISASARMLNTLFNTSSGCIEIGDYTFASHNVSILTGNHDYRLLLEQRISTFADDGRDVLIGKGVWLCSNSLILGPCTIGDHAVIAAGAVVVPGTIVGEGEIYAGIPAKKISSI